MTPRIVIAGRGHIGSYMDRALREAGHHVFSYDLRSGHDLSDAKLLRELLKGARVVVDTLPYTLNRSVATIAADLGVAYFNLTEDVENTKYIQSLTSSAPLVPQCGLAPGMVSIIAQQLTRTFTRVDTIHVRVGALPATQMNHLGYALTWSAAGLVNEYCHPCDVVQQGARTTVPALDGLETITLDGQMFEAAYTSGGIGTLADTWAGSAREVNYKTLRYPGHFGFMRILRDDLRMADYKHLAESWFTQALPRTTEDMVVIAIQVRGVTGDQPDGSITTSTYTERVYSTIHGTAIQQTTAHGALAVVDAYLNGHLTTAGFVRQEDIPYDAIRASGYSAVYNLP